jgi:hypothetical protein
MPARPFTPTDEPLGLARPQASLVIVRPTVDPHVSAAPRLLLDGDGA